MKQFLRELVSTFRKRILRQSPYSEKSSKKEESKKVESSSIGYKDTRKKQSDEPINSLTIKIDAEAALILSVASLIGKWLYQNSTKQPSNFQEKPFLNEKDFQEKNR